MNGVGIVGGEMYNFRQLSAHLNRGRWERLKDWTREGIKRMKEDKETRVKQSEA